MGAEIVLVLRINWERAKEFGGHIIIWTMLIKTFMPQ